ncbi:MAG: DUF454 domain-containing protein [bacterium]|nr:DUF454 domain-containing protein [bacterium]
MEPDPENSGPPVKEGLARYCLLALGSLFAVLGSLGAFLPVLPTTPFLLLAAACFARSSPAFHQRLLANRIFGPYIAQWQRDHTIPCDAKRKAYTVVVLTFTLSIWFVGAAWLRGLLAGIGVSLLVLLARLPTSSSSVE